MSEQEIRAIYDTHLDDLWNVFQERFDELAAAPKPLSEFDDGKYLAYTEILDSMKTRLEMIRESLEEK